MTLGDQKIVPLTHCWKFFCSHNNRQRNFKAFYFPFSSAVTNFTHVFSRHEFHYLNVPKVGTVTVDDIFDCTFECLQTLSCVSVNLAASKGANGRLWCEILSSDKYLNPTEYKENGTSHHFSKVRSTCMSTLGIFFRI